MIRLHAPLAYSITIFGSTSISQFAQNVFSDIHPITT